MDSVSGVGVIDKGVARFFERSPRVPSIWQRCRTRPTCPRATAHRLAVALELHGLVRRDPQGRFCLGFELIRLGRAAEDQFPLAELDAADSHGTARRNRRERAAVRPRRLTAVAACVSLRVDARTALDRSAGRVAPARSRLRRRVLQGDDIAESVEEREPGVASVSAAVQRPQGTGHRRGQPQRARRAVEPPASPTVRPSGQRRRRCRDRSTGPIVDPK